MPELEGPDDGHTFRLVVTSRMSSSVVGDEHHTDADHFGPPMTLDVRAFSLPAALRKAADVPLNEWQHEDQPYCGTWPFPTSDLDIVMPEDNAAVHRARGCCDG